MSFRTRPIRKRSASRSIKQSKKWMTRLLGGSFKMIFSYRKQLIVLVMILIATGIVYRVTASVYKAVRNFSPDDIILSIGDELRVDEDGHVNIVLLGDGGHERDGADLVDTIMVATLDLEENRASLISVPRDFYVRDEIYGSAKINEFYRDHRRELGDEAGYMVFPEVLGRVFDLDIPYYLRVDFRAFVEVVDAMGGIEVDVEKAIYDPYYPNETDNGYTVFDIDVGPQTLNGERALKFVRSRKTTSDFDRAARQQQVLAALQQKALSKNVLTSPTVIKDLYQSINKNMNTNLGIREILALAKFAKDFDRSQMVAKVLHDDPSQEGGFLYTPERKYYHGQFVLVPFGNNLNMIRQYANMVFHHPEIYRQPISLEILNGTARPGLARELASQLNRFGWNIEKIDNYVDDKGKRRKDIQKTFTQFNKWQMSDLSELIPTHQSYLNELKKFFVSEWLPSDSVSEADPIDVSIVTGSDYEWLVK